MFQSIQSRLYLIFGAVFAIFWLGVGGYASVASSSARQMRAEYHGDIQASVLLAKAQDSVWALRLGFAQFIALGDSKPEARANARVLLTKPIHREGRQTRTWLLEPVEIAALSDRLRRETN